LSHQLRLLVADRAPTRLGIRMALDGEVVVCAEADDAGQAIRAAKREQPDVCLIGSELAGDGLSAVRGICRAAPRAVVVVLAADPDPQDLLDCIRAGAVGYVPGAVDGAGLRRIVRAVSDNEAAIPRVMVLELLMELRNSASSGDGLTSRESEVLGMVRRGYSTAEVADRLKIAPVTVRRHISKLVHKLGLENRSGLVSASPGWGGQPVTNGAVHKL
jgi:DNA-binding NarL/FixJ family response regulator